MVISGDPYRSHALNTGRERDAAIAERRDELTSTMSGLEVEPLYTPASVEIDYERDLGRPGEYPFTRGVYPSMYRGRTKVCASQSIT
jgi:methylmalonyl-CoA mutase N-terminal domain/subunit